jgi:hypothetical protein
METEIYGLGKKISNGQIIKNIRSGERYALWGIEGVKKTWGQRYSKHHSES